jgi:hypothetical protein
MSISILDEYDHPFESLDESVQKAFPYIEAIGRVMREECKDLIVNDKKFRFKKEGGIEYIDGKISKISYYFMIKNIETWDLLETLTDLKNRLEKFHYVRFHKNNNENTKSDIYYVEINYSALSKTDFFRSIISVDKYNL